MSHPSLQLSSASRPGILIGTSIKDSSVSRHFVALGKHLVERGYSVTLLVHGNEGLSENDLRPLETWRWPSPRPTRAADALSFWRLLNQRTPQCLVSNFGANALMMTLGALARVPVRICWYHTLSSAIDLDSGHNRYLLRLLRWRARIPLGLSTAVVANSNAARQDLQATFGVQHSKCKIFWNSMSDPLALSAFRRVSASHGEVRPRLVCVGRFAPCKGQDIIIRALRHVVAVFPELTVEFIGDGVTKPVCEALAVAHGVAACCVFAGGLSHADVLRKMADAAATVVPSRSEAFGLINIESMGVGTPVVASRTGGIPEIIREGVDGLLFPPGDHQALADCLVRLLGSHELRSRMSSNCRQRFLEHFELSRAVKAETDWLCQLIKHHP